MSAQTHVILQGSERRLRHGAAALGAANPQEWVDITIKIRAATALPALDSKLDKPLTHEQFAARYGASAADLAAVRAAITKLGLTVTSESAAARSVTAGGSVAVMEAAFEVKLLNYQLGQELYRGRVGPVHIPRELDGIVVGVFGLDNRRMVVPRRRRGAPLAMSAVTAAARSWFKPQELAAIYDFPPGDGDGESIGLIEFGGGFFKDDFATFCAAVDVPASATIVPVSVDHTSTKKRDGTEGEVMLDVEIVGALCPKATIPIYFAHWSEKGWIDVLDAALQDTKNKPTVLSISYGLAEGQETWTASAMDQIDHALQSAKQLGITILAAAGDDGTDAQVGDGLAHVNFPASSPAVLAVGGTNLFSVDRVHRDSESTWFEGSGIRQTNGGSTGGGVSAHFPKPEWQPAIPSVDPGGATGRCVPDVAALANFSGYLLVVDGSSEPNGGTSAATPLWASLLGRINAARRKDGKSSLGYITDRLYGASQTAGKSVGAVACFDVVSGNNATAKGVSGYAAGPGYDCTTGWGSPIGSALLAELG